MARVKFQGVWDATPHNNLGRGFSQAICWLLVMMIIMTNKKCFYFNINEDKCFEKFQRYKNNFIPNKHCNEFLQ